MILELRNRMGQNIVLTMSGKIRNSEKTFLINLFPFLIMSYSYNSYTGKLNLNTLELFMNDSTNKKQVLLEGND